MPPFSKTVFPFLTKQISACLFGLCMLGLIIGTSLIDLQSLGLYRYDVLFIGALTIQALLMLFKLETKQETIVIFTFHIVATFMELFKTSGSIGAWQYPGPTLFHIGNVPLFAGFMYSAVGSYFARSWRLFRVRFTSYPPFWTTVLLAVLIYANFYTHHYITDIRYWLFVMTGILFGRTYLFFTITKKERKIPLLIPFLGISVCIWIAENIGTYTKVWLYPHQQGNWEMVGVSKIAAWFLLMIVSFVLVSVVKKKDLG